MKHTTRHIAKQGLFFSGAFILGNLLNLVFNFYLGRTLSSPDFALVALFMGVLYAINVFLNTLSITVCHLIGISRVHVREKVITHISLVWGRRTLVIGLVISFVWVFVLPFLAALWKVEPTALVFFLPIFVLGTLVSLNRGILQGNSRFTDSGAIFLTESGTKLLAAITFVAAGVAGWAYLAIPISILIAYLVSAWLVRKSFTEKDKLSRTQSLLAGLFPRRFFFFSFLLGLSTLTFLSIDVILAKTFFLPEEAGGYALITLGGKMLFFFSSLLGAILISVVSNAVGEGKSTKNIFRVFFGISFAIISVGTIFFLIFGEQFFLFFFGQKVLGMLSIFPLYIIAIAAFSLSNTIVLYHHAKREFIFPIISSISAIFLIIGAIAFHATLGQFVGVLFVVAIFDIVAVSILHLVDVYTLSQPANNEEYITQGLPPVTEQSFTSLSAIPTVTIGIPAYNEQHNISNLLKQILSQKQEGFVIEKIIVASDGSTDDTVKIVREYENRGVVIIEGKDNNGQDYRQNEIISNTSSDILVLLNADILLGDDEVIFRLISPVLGGTDLSAQWAKPLAPRTFIERVLCAGFGLKYFIYTHHKNGDNIYTCVGHMRALSRKFYSNVVFPTVSDGEDQYLYLACISGGYRYKYTHSVNSYFKLPDTFSDYKKYAKRIFQTQKKYDDVFSGQLVHAERSLPIGLQIRGFIYGVIKHPLYALYYIVLHIIMQQWALRQPMNSAHVFETSTSTKNFSDNISS